MSETLLWGVKNGDLEQVKSILDPSGQDVNGELEGGRSAMHFAADYGQLEIIKYLVSKSANINLMDKFGITPILAAVYEGHVECVKYLISQGADKEGVAPDGLPYVECAEKEEIKALLKK